MDYDYKQKGDPTDLASLCNVKDPWSTERALREGYRPLSRAMQLRTDHWILNNMMLDCLWYGVLYQLVREGDEGVAVWCKDKDVE